MSIKKYFKDILFFFIAFWITHLFIITKENTKSEYFSSILGFLALIYGIFVMSGIGTKIANGQFNQFYLLGKSPIGIHLELIKIFISYLFNFVFIITLTFLIIGIYNEIEFARFNINFFKKSLKALTFFSLLIYLTTPVFLFLGNKNAMYFYIVIIVFIMSTDFYLLNNGNQAVVQFIKQYGITQVLNAVLSRTCNLTQLFIFLGIYNGVFMLNVAFVKRICYIRDHH